MAQSVEDFVRASLDRAGVAADEAEIGRIIEALNAARKLRDPGRRTEPYLRSPPREWRR